MDPIIERSLAERASTQLGLFTTTQARDAGMSRKVLRHRLTHGSLRLVGNQVLWPADLPPSTPHLRVMAACLDVDGVASHRTAAWLHGCADVGRLAPIEVMARRGGRTRTTPLARVHLTTSLDPEDVLLVGGVPTTSVARTLLGVASLVPDEVGRGDLVGAVEAAVRDRQASDRWLWWLLEERRCRGRNGVRALESVLAERARLGPTESWLERETLRVLGAAGLPLPHVQCVIRQRGAFVTRVDFAYPDQRVLMEVEGKVHAADAQRAIDAHQRNVGQLLGHTVLTYTYDQVVRTPQVMVEEVRCALAGQPLADLSRSSDDLRAEADAESVRSGQ